ncbi:MAG: response regulator [Planctomycetota bacterium]
MAQTVRAILFTTNETAAPQLRKTITSLPHLRIVAELDEPSLLGHAATQFPADLLIADLDPNAPVVIECLKQLRDVRPDLAVFALSSETEGDVVLKALRAGIKEYLVKPLDLDEFEQAVSRAIQTQPQTKQPGKLISVIGSAGGVGCTTIATNLAVELAELVGSEQKVSLVDLDFRFGHVATLLDVHGQFTVADLCSTPEHLDEQMVMKALIKYEQNLYILRRPHSFAQAEMITAAHCANVLSSLQETCAYVVVDGPTRQDPGGRSVLDSADFNFLILQLLVTSVRNTDRMMQELGVQGFNTDRIQFVCNRVGRESSHLGVDQVETILGRKMFALLSDDWKSVSSSINIGQPLKVEFTNSRIRQELRTLAMQVHCPETVSGKAGKRGLFGKLLGKGGSHKAPSTKPAGGEVVANAT